MRVSAWIAIGLVVAALTVLVFPLVQIQTELRLANEQVVQARARIAELDRVVTNLKTELDAANRARTQLQGGLDEANSEIEKRQSAVERLSAELEKATNFAKDAEAQDQEGDSVSEPSDCLAAAKIARLRNQGEASIVAGILVTTASNSKGFSKNPSNPGMHIRRITGFDKAKPRCVRHPASV